MRREDSFLTALLSSNTTREACRIARISERAGYAMLAKPDFKARYQAARDELFQAAVNTIRRNIGRACDVAIEIMDNPESAPYVKLSACRLILEQGLRAIETSDILTRLTAIEARIFAENSREKEGF